MIILGVETATMTGGIGIVKDQSLLAELRLNVRTTHSERLLPGLDHLLKCTQLEIADIDLLAVSIGPGSFTGLRVGLSMVKGLSFATGKPVVPVPTLEALAWNFSFSGMPVCPLLDARKKELYGGLFAWNGRELSFERIIPESVMAPSDWAEVLKEKYPGPKILAGEGTLLYRDCLENAGNVVFATPEKMAPSPAGVAFLGGRMAAMRSESVLRDPAGLSPFYIRKSEAELKGRQP